MPRKFPGISRFYSKLVFELLPGALISALGAMLLNQYYVRPTVAPATASNGAEIVQVVRDEQARFLAYLKKDEDARSEAEQARAAKPETKTVLRVEKPEKRVAAKPASLHPAKTMVGPPLQLARSNDIAVAPLPPPAIAAPAPRNESVVVAKLRDAATTVQQIPARVQSAATGWFAEELPPRPPAPIPGQNFLNASM